MCYVPDSFKLVSFIHEERIRCPLFILTTADFFFQIFINKQALKIGSSQPILHSHALLDFSSPAQMPSQETPSTLTQENHLKGSSAMAVLIVMKFHLSVYY